MKDLLAKSYSGEGFKEDATAIIELISEHINSTGDLPTLKWMEPDDQLRFWEDDFSSPSNTTALELFDSVIKQSLNIRSPKYMGHQVAVTLPLTVISSTVIAYLNQSLPVYEMGMVGNTLERIIIKHLVGKFNYGPDASGVITSGGTMANLTALLTARSNFEESDYKDLVILVSAEAHYSIERAAMIMGLPAENVIKVPVNESFQMQFGLLDNLYQQSLSAGKKILCVVGCACSTAVGAYDNLNAIGDWANSKDVWFHVDGAHGAAAIYSPTYKSLLNGIEKADSIILDFHKLLMAPSLSTALLYKNGQFAKRTFAQKAEYLFAEQDNDDWYNSGKRTFECTKPMHILNTYAILRIYGEKIYEQNIDRLYGMARDFADIIRGNEAFELAIEPQSNIVCFRHRERTDINEVNKKIATHLIHTGTYFIVNTVIDGEFWLRVALQNPLTAIRDLESLLQHITELREVIIK